MQPHKRPGGRAESLSSSWIPDLPRQIVGAMNLMRVMTESRRRKFHEPSWQLAEPQYRHILYRICAIA